MSKPEPNRDGLLAMFYKKLEGLLSMDDYQQFYSNKTKNGRDTYLCSDIFSNDIMSAIILEEYGVRGKLGGNVFVAYPKPEYNVPIFGWQLGGNDKQKIAMLDINATQADIDYTPLKPVFEKYQDLLDLDPPKLDWVKEISSPYLIHRQYDELDVELFMEATYEYLAIWLEHYYKPAKLLETEEQKREAEVAIYKYKRILHDNDPAYGIFKKEWGTPVADAFFYVETRDHPALPMPVH